MLLQTAINNYIAVHKMENCSEHTLSNLQQNLSLFATWLEATYQITDTDELTVAHLRAWVVYLQGTPLEKGVPRKGSTINLYSVKVKSFCRWLEQEEVISKSITARFKVPRVEQEFIPTFTPDDVEKLLEACESGGGRWKNNPQMCKAITARNRAIVSVLLDTGIRLCEIAQLRLGDIDRDMRVLLVHRKGNKWQQVPISWDGFKVLHEYLTKHRPRLAKLSGSPMTRKDDLVFIGDTGRPLTESAIKALFGRIKEKSDIEGKRVSPHNCRRYMATTQLANGRSPLDVQRQMGHTTLTMTNRYASLSVQQLRDSHDKYAPLRAKKDRDKEVNGSGYWDSE